jgi:hypothetical protein
MNSFGNNSRQSLAAAKQTLLIAIGVHGGGVIAINLVSMKCAPGSKTSTRRAAKSWR